MPFGVVYLPPPELWKLLAAQTQRPRITRGPYVLEADNVRLDPEAEITTLTGNVTVVYNNPPVNGRQVPATRITCEEAVVDNAKEEARFTRGVKLVDEIGTLQANELYVSYKQPGHGYAHGIVLDAYEAHFEGEELTFEEGAYRLKNAWFTTCREHYRVLLSDVVVRPGQFIAAKSSGFRFGNGLTIPVPFFRVGLNPRETGIQSPVPSVNEDFKWGYRWRNILDVGKQFSIQVDQMGGESRVPTLNSQLVYTLATRKSSPSLAAPRSPDGERFTESYMDSVSIPEPGDETELVGDSPDLIFVGRTTNVGTRARPGSVMSVDRSWYAGAQLSTMLGSVALGGQIFYGDYGERLTGSSKQRLEGYGTISAPTVGVGGGLALRLRADIAVISEGSGYGWFRPQVGLSYAPGEHLAVTASYLEASDWGAASHTTDELYSKRAAHLRADLRFPSTELSLLLKYDFDRKDLYDIEVSLRQVADCIRPFIAYRRFPGTLTLGFSLRANNLFDALKRRVPKRGEGQ